MSTMHFVQSIKASIDKKKTQYDQYRLNWPRGLCFISIWMKGQVYGYVIQSCHRKEQRGATSIRIHEEGRYHMGPTHKH